MRNGTSGSSSSELDLCSILIFAEEAVKTSDGDGDDAVSKNTKKDPDASSSNEIGS
jgi:hypothetical protein